MSASAVDATAPPAPSSFRELYDRYFAFTWRTLRYLGVDAAQLDDAVQELWVIVHRRLDEFEGRSDMKTWLFRIAVNVQRNMYRSMRRHRPLAALPPEIVSPAPDPALEREGRETWSQVQAFLEGLDETRRMVFVLSLLEGLSPAETAEVTGLELATVYHKTSALRRSFRQWVARRAEAE